MSHCGQNLWMPWQKMYVYTQILGTQPPFFVAWLVRVFLKHFSEARCSENEAEGWDERGGLARRIAIFNGKILRGDDTGKKIHVPWKKIHVPWKKYLQPLEKKFRLLWPCGPLAVWSFGPLVLWLFGPLVLWSCGPLVLWSSGPLVLWSSGPLVLWSCGRVVLWSSDPKIL